MPLNIDDNRVALAIPPILRLAFRPFFLGGALFSIIAIAWWSWFWLKPSSWTPYGGAIWWHSHEMIFGFAAAIVVGFLLTAVQTWTGVRSVRGLPLAILFGFWLLGRVAVAFGGAWPVALVMAIDSLFLLAAAGAMAYPVLKVKQWRNIMFVPILLMLALFNAVSHWAVLNQHYAGATQALYGAVLLVSLVVAIVGGRVMPMFTANGTGTEKVLSLKWLELSSLFSLALIVVLSFVGFEQFPKSILVSLFGFAALVNGWRFVRWGFWRCWRVPLLWSLHMAYAFLPIGLLAMALHHAGLLVNSSAALHCFAVGTVGGMILAMISRVTLGHTGRVLEPPKPMALAFILILLAAMVRVVLPVWLPVFTNWGIGLAGVFWLLAYGLFVIYYGPMLMSARVDGRPG